MDIVANIQSFTESLPTALRFLGVVVAAFIPYIEGEGAAIIGIIAGMEPWLAIPVAILANLAIVVVIVLSFEKIRAAIINRRIAAGKTPKPASEKQQKVRRALDKYGVPGASLLGPFLLPTHFTAAALTSFGITKGRVITWQAVAIFLYSTVFGLAFYGVLSVVA